MGWIEEHQEHEIEKQHKRIYFGEAFSEQLEIWKRKRDKSEKDFAKAIGVHPNMVTKWKQGKSFPQADNMAAICKEMGINESYFVDLSGIYVNNSSRKEWSRNLQIYADANGFDEEFYEWLIRMPDFVRVFPFHSIEDGNNFQNVYVTEPPKDHPEEKPFALVKFEFEDDFGNRKMMNKEDLDFILNIQEEARKHAWAFCLAEKTKVMERRLDKRMQRYLKDYPGLDDEEVKRRYNGANFIDEEIEIYEDTKLKQIVQEVARTAGIRPRINPNSILPPFDEEEVAQIFRDQGYKEEEIAKKVEEERQGDEFVRNQVLNSYRKQGYIVEEEGNGNG